MNTTPLFSARIALAALVTLSTTALAENFFSEEPVWSSGTTLSGGDGIARFIDYDRDGDMDFLTSAPDPYRWVIYQNVDGKISKTPIWESNETSDLDHIDVLDFNGDGWTDLAATHETHCTIYINKRGSFDVTPDWETGLIVNANQIHFADMDGDKDLDMVMAAGPPLNGVAIFENKGGGIDPKSESRSGFPSRVPTLKLGHDEYSETAIFVDYDQDGDGYLDILAHYAGGKDIVYRNTKGIFDEGTVLYDDPKNPWTQRHVMFDLDGDGINEVFSAKGPWGGPGQSLQLVKKDGKLTPIWKSPANTMYHAFEFHDIDGDGDADALASDYTNGGQVAVFLNNDGKLSKNPVEIVQATGPVHEAVLADIDLDGDLDLAVGGRDQSHIFENLTINTGYHSAANRFRNMINAEFVFSPSVISGNEFPSADFLNASQAKRMLGDYTIDTTFYANDYQVTENPKDHGRYGAIVKITAEDGTVYTRYRTLFKTGGSMKGGTPGQLQGEVTYPGSGIDDAIWKNQKRYTDEYVASAVARDTMRSHDLAILLAGFNELSPDQDEVTQLASAMTKDRQWWLTLKRQLNGNAERFKRPINAPEVVEGLNARVLRNGSERDAGMKKGTAKNIDAILQEWAENSDQPFNATVARNGVVFFNEAYGSRNGKPITTDTKHVVYSISKALSGSLLMTFIEHADISLDEPVSHFLPEFDDSLVDIPLTFHHLFTHTADTDGHFTDLQSDLEHVYGEAYPYLAIGKQLRYNGTGIALGLKALEQISGLALPNLYQEFLFGPLGCESIESIDGSAMTWSNAYDLARAGQMLANHGAYGDYRFFSEETFQQMLPAKLTPVLGEDTTIVWGIGLTPYGGNGLSDNTIGHGSASSCTLRIDLDNDLIITMTRQTAGKNFYQYHPKFIQAITNGLPGKEDSTD